VEETKNHYATMYYREALRTSYFEFGSAFDKYRDICNNAKRKMNKTLVMRYLEWQMIILSPIAPHFCETGWEMLEKKGSVLDAKWPAPTKPVDTLIVTQGMFMYDKVPHDFVKLMEKASKGGKPSSATVYVATKFPDWKVSVLSTLRARHAKGELPLVSPEEMKDSATAKAQWKEIMAELMSDASLKPFGKHLGPFAAFKRDEAALLGESALSATALFDELALIRESLTFLAEKLGCGVEVLDVKDIKCKEHQDAAANAQPGKPVIYYDGCVGGAPAKAGGGGGKAGAGAAKGKPANGSAVAFIKDLKALNEHLSTRSYFEGGAGPTAADDGQLAQLPKGAVSDESYPHVARWQRHISHFSPVIRAKW